MQSLRVWMATSVWPEATSSAAGLRVMQWIKAMRMRNWQIRVHSASQQNQFTQALVDEGVGVVVPRGEVEQGEGGIDVNHPTISEELARFNPDIVWMDRFVVEEQLSWRAAEVCPQALRVLDTHDLHFLRKSRRPGGAPKDWESQRNRELASIWRSDCSLILSSFEMEFLVREYQMSLDRIHWSTFAYPIAPRASWDAGFGKRKHLAFIGNYRHEPNLDAGLFLAQELWPEIRRNLPPGTELHLMGAYIPKSISDCQAIEGVRVKGWVKDACETLARYRLALAPLRFGAGIKGKITDAWWSGTPCVASPIGWEGLLPSGEKMFDDTPRDWGQWPSVCADWYSNEKRWMEVQRQGWDWMDGYHSESLAMKTLSHLEDLKNDLAHVRARNSVGAILRESERLWTANFAKWIAEKNKGRN